MLHNDWSTLRLFSYKGIHIFFNGQALIISLTRHYWELFVHAVLCCWLFCVLNNVWDVTSNVRCGLTMDMQPCKRILALLLILVLLLIPKSLDQITHLAFVYISVLSAKCQQRYSKSHRLLLTFRSELCS